MPADARLGAVVLGAGALGFGLGPALVVGRRKPAVAAGATSFAALAAWTAWRTP